MDERFGVRYKDDGFLWNLVTARVPFAHWEKVTITFCRPWQKHDNVVQIWPEPRTAFVHQGPSTERRVVGHDTSEQAARDALRNFQNLATEDAQASEHGAAGHTHNIELLDTHTEWKLDVRVKP